MKIRNNRKRRRFKYLTFLRYYNSQMPFNENRVLGGQKIYNNEFTEAFRFRGNAILII